MKHPIPESFITTIDLSPKFSDLRFDIRVSFTVFGEVLQVECPFFQLPDEARSLMLGTQRQYTERRLKAYTEIQAFVFPLMVLEVYTEGVSDQVRQEVNKLKKTGWEEVVDPKLHIIDPWTQKAWEKQHTRQGEELKWAVKLLFGGYSDQPQALRRIDAENGPFLLPILIHLASYAENYASIWPEPFKALGRVQTPAAQQFLSDILAGPDQYHWHVHALAGLAHYENDAVRRQLLDYYKHNPPRVTMMINLLEAIMPYQDHEVNAVFFQELIADYQTSYITRDMAFDELQKRGISGMEILEFLRPNVSEERSLQQLKHVLAIYKRSGIPATTDDVLDLYESIIRQTGQHQMVPEIAQLLKKIGIYLAMPKIGKMVQASSIPTRVGALALMKEVIRPGQIELVLPLLADPEIKVRLEALHTIDHLAKGRGLLQSVKPLLAMITNDEVEVRLKALQAIRHSLSPINFGIAQQPLLSQLEHSDAGIREMVLKLLSRFPPGPEVIARVGERIADPDTNVQQAARNALESYRKQKRKNRQSASETTLSEEVIRWILILLVLALSLWLLTLGN